MSDVLFNSLSGNLNSVKLERRADEQAFINSDRRYVLGEFIVARIRLLCPRDIASHAVDPMGLAGKPISRCSLILPLKVFTLF